MGSHMNIFCPQFLVISHERFWFLCVFVYLCAPQAWLHWEKTRPILPPIITPTLFTTSFCLLKKTTNLFVHTLMNTIVNVMQECRKSTSCFPFHKKSISLLCIVTMKQLHKWCHLHEKHAIDKSTQHFVHTWMKTNIRNSLLYLPSYRYYSYY